MISKEIIEKAKKCTTKEELLDLAKSENIDLSETEVDKFLTLVGKNKILSEEELDNVSGGTCYGDGWDGVSRPIVTDSNGCKLFQAFSAANPNCDEVCPNCMYYSGIVNGRTISMFSGWCTHPQRIEGSDVIND